MFGWKKSVGEKKSKGKKKTNRDLKRLAFALWVKIKLMLAKKHRLNLSVAEKVNFLQKASAFLLKICSFIIAPTNLT
jgi:Fe-S cluster biosynthesis and repair protein YggX